MSGRCRITPLWAVLLALVVLIGIRPCRADEAANPGKPKKSTTGAVFRSLFAPGWGQLYNESYMKAAAFAVTEGLLIYSASHENDQMMRFKKGNNFIWEKHYRNSRNRLIWWLSGVILLSMGDAYVDAQLYGIDVSPDLSPESGAVGITVSRKF